MKTELLYGDCLDLMKDLPDACIDMVLTSPPYDNLRAYNGSSVWGKDIWEPIISDLFRIVKPGGVVVWVVADATVKGGETGSSFKQALFAISAGFRLHDTMIYSKSNNRPRQNNRYEQTFEFMFVFSKGAPKTVNLRKIPCKHAGLPRSNITSRDHDKDDLTVFSTTINSHKNDSNVWFYETGFGKSAKDKYVFGHPAIFPEKLAEDHILSWSNPGDVILDIFMGSGTTGKMALQNGRNFIGMEMDFKYFRIAKKRIREAKDAL